MWNIWGFWADIRNLPGSSLALYKAAPVSQRSIPLVPLVPSEPVDSSATHFLIPASSSFLVELAWVQRVCALFVPGHIWSFCSIPSAAFGLTVRVGKGQQSCGHKNRAKKKRKIPKSNCILRRTSIGVRLSALNAPPHSCPHAAPSYHGRQSRTHLAGFVWDVAAGNW
jgi:hypothetical protein